MNNILNDITEIYNINVKSIVQQYNSNVKVNDDSRNIHLNSKVVLNKKDEPWEGSIKESEISFIFWMCFYISLIIDLMRFKNRNVLSKGYKPKTNLRMICNSNNIISICIYLFSVVILSYIIMKTTQPFHMKEYIDLIRK